jgi:hypothetical protein
MNTRTVVRLLVPAAAGLLLAPATGGAAQDRIVVNRSIGPIAVGDERAEIAGGTGVAGRVVTRRPDPRRPGNRNLDRVEVRYLPLGITARFLTDEASTTTDLVVTSDRRYRTAAGVGVGSTTTRVRLLFPSAACSPEGTFCRAGARVPGRTVTTFRLRDDRVVAVELRRLPRR